jgi:hypothetical protein
MDPIWMGVLAMFVPVSTPLCYQWIRSRTTVRLAQLDQQGLSDRVRCLPQGSRLSESSRGREVVVEVGCPVSGKGGHG